MNPNFEIERRAESRSGEHMPRACGFRRRAENFAPPIFRAGLFKKCVTSGPARRRNPARRRRALVRLRRREDRAVEVRSCAAKSRAVSNRNCVVATRGGEHRNENDQSVTQAAQAGSRRELDSVGVDGRVFERKTKPAKRAIGEAPNRRATGQTPVVAPMVGDGMGGSPRAETRETRQCWRVRWANRPRAGLAGVRASVVAEKRVTTVEQRGLDEDVLV